MDDVIERIRTYYQRIDANDTDWVLRLFAPDAVYERADATYTGQEELRRFFCEKRQIRGEHAVEAIWAVDDASTVIAVGRFSGAGAAGDAREVEFVDIWYFNAGGSAKRRRTFLALGSRYVEA